MFGALLAIASIGSLFADLDFKIPNTSLMKDLKCLLKIVEFDVFLVAAIFSGMFCGFSDEYLFWFLDELGGSKSLMGLCLTVSCLSGIPPLVLSDKIFRRLGHPNVQVLGFIVFVIRLIGIP